MAKPRIMIAETDANYIFPLQQKFVEEFFEKIELEIITDKEFFNQVFSSPQSIDILIISEELYSQSIQRHNVPHIFLMKEQDEKELEAAWNVSCIYKYQSVKDIFIEITGKSSDVLKKSKGGKQETQVVLLSSGAGGTGKTTLAMGISAYLAKDNKRTLYINAAYLQTFHHMLKNSTPITAAFVYAKLSIGGEDSYRELRHILREEQFKYLPPFKAALMSLGLNYSVYKDIVLAAKKSGDFDYIIVDTDVTFDEAKAELFNIADKIIVVTNQSVAALSATNTLVTNINGVDEDKYIFVCNKYIKENDNTLSSTDTTYKFSVSEYVEYIEEIERKRPIDLAEDKGIQRIAFLII